MQRRENYLYVGMDLHKDTHTAVLVNCWNEKLDVMVIKNKPSEFGKLAKRVNKKATALQERLKDLRVERGLAQFLPKLRNYNGIGALKRMLRKTGSLNVADALYRATKGA